MRVWAGQGTSGPNGRQVRLYRPKLTGKPGSHDPVGSQRPGNPPGEDRREDEYLWDQASGVALKQRKQRRGHDEQAECEHDEDHDPHDERQPHEADDPRPLSRAVRKQPGGHQGVAALLKPWEPEPETAVGQAAAYTPPRGRPIRERPGTVAELIDDVRAVGGGQRTVHVYRDAACEEKRRDAARS